jgi:predicted ATPase
MVKLRDLGLNGDGGKREGVSILVGPNGSGKSSVLLEIAARYRNNRNVAIICNTPHDRFVGLRGVKRIVVGRSHQSPKNLVKRAVADALHEKGSAFYQISAILDHCGYEARFGFEIIQGPRYKMTAEELRQEDRAEMAGDEALAVVLPREEFILETAMSFLQRHEPKEQIWVNSTDSVFEFSRAREFVSVLKLESILRRLKVISEIRVLLKRKENGEVIEMRHASSGQLSLISSLLYLITNVGEDPLIIIDEPENSLHPSWQRDYIEKVLAAMNFRNASLVVATHAPLVVTGALASSPNLVSVFQVRDGVPRRLFIETESDSSNSIEEVLWLAFDIVTPANHFVSEQIVDEISRFEKGKVSKDDVLQLIEKMEANSFDDRQKEFFDAVKKLLDKVENAQNGLI